MVIHERIHDQRGAGKWDLGSTRYIPIGGGSRSRLPMQDDPEYPRYYGFVGVDDRLSESLYTISGLYGYLGGAPSVPAGEEGGFTALILEQTRSKLLVAKEGEDE